MSSIHGRPCSAKSTAEDTHLQCAQPPHTFKHTPCMAGPSEKLGDFERGSLGAARKAAMQPHASIRPSFSTRISSARRGTGCHQTFVSTQPACTPKAPTAAPQMLQRQTLMACVAAQRSSACCWASAAAQDCPAPRQHPPLHHRHPLLQLQSLA
jgi:hypothetical protein